MVSHLNFTVQSVLNAGRYACLAVNPHGRALHEGRLEVSGQTRIKPMRSRSVVAQQLSTMLDCNIVGSTPINFNWLKDGLQVPFNHRQRVHKNASLEILNIDKKTDSGNQIRFEHPNRSSRIRTTISKLRFFFLEGNYTCVVTINTTSGHVQTTSESMLLSVKGNSL